MDIYEALVETLMEVRDPRLTRSQFKARVFTQFEKFDEFDLGKFEYWIDSYWLVED